MKKFWELLEESVIVQGIITTLVMLVIAIQQLAPVFQQLFNPAAVPMIISAPPEMWGLAGIIVGYYFGTKQTMAVRKEMEAQRKLLAEYTNAVKVTRTE